MPLSDKPGNGYHINIYAKNDEGEDVVRYAAAGIMQRIREMTLFLNPTDASYIRFGNSSAPDRVSWSSDGDAELMYVEEYMGRVRAELRSPDASSNPYLIYALLIYAGLEGIANKQTLPEIMKEGAMLPSSKKEAIKFANESDFIKKYLPEDLIKVYSM